MKGLIKIATAVSVTLLAISSYSANNMNNKNTTMMKNKHMWWICETNASSATTDADKKADEKMAAGEKSAKSAFDYAMKHCRDCTKITCVVKNKS